MREAGAGGLGRQNLGKVLGVVGLSAAVLVADDPPLSKANVSRAAREIEGDGAGLEASSSSSSGEPWVRLVLLRGAAGCFPLAAAVPLAVAAPHFPALVIMPCSPGEVAVPISSKLRQYSNTSLCV